MTAPIASGWSGLPGGICTHWKAPPLHGAHPQRTSSWFWPALASALVANDWTVELTGLITSRGQRKLAPAGARSGAALGPRWPHNFDSRQLAFFTMLHL